jgi:O-antigen ligase
MMAIMALTATALFATFSRGAYLALALPTLIVFMRGASKKRALFLFFVGIVCLVAPAPLLDRIAYGLPSGDVNEISAGRVDNLWLPLLPDLAEHLWFGQGLQSIMWTEAQRMQEIFPVSVAHNAFLDLVLDFGLVGALPILAWYVYLWVGLARAARTDPDAHMRAFFNGGKLAVLAFLLSSTTNNRLTPTATSCVLWLVAGVLLGRELKCKSDLPQLAREATSKRSWRPLVRMVRTSTLTPDGV